MVSDTGKRSRCTAPPQAGGTTRGSQSSSRQRQGSATWGDVQSLTGTNPSGIKSSPCGLVRLLLESVPSGHFQHEHVQLSPISRPTAGRWWTAENRGGDRMHQPASQHWGTSWGRGSQRCWQGCRGFNHHTVIFTTWGFGLLNKTVQFKLLQPIYCFCLGRIIMVVQVLFLISHLILCKETPHQIGKEVILTVPAVSRISSIHC